MKILIANRGEIAIRIARAAAELEIPTVAVYARDDATSLHVKKADEAVALPGAGARAYLDIDALVDAACQQNCTAIHPGYGFLSEHAEFARACAASGLRFIGPSPEVLDLLGNKVVARQRAAEASLPVLPGTSGPTSLEQACDFFDQLAASQGMVIKAVAGGGGRGMRIVTNRDDLGPFYERCRSEALAAFGNDEVYVEQLIGHARHIEVQVVADRLGETMHLWERDCTLQRRNQKLVEIAPSPFLHEGLRQRVLTGATSFARSIGYEGLGTFEFLIDLDAADPDESVHFIEANPRLQVEHTVTEEVTGVDLVKTQIQIAVGSTLQELGLDVNEPPSPAGFAIQLRVNMETMSQDGSPLPSSGTITAFEGPGGAGIRLDALGYTGYRTTSQFDSLLAKLIVHSPNGTFADTVRRARRALAEFRIDGVATNVQFLSALIARPELIHNDVHTRFIEEHIDQLLAATATQNGQRLYFESGVDQKSTVGARVDTRDPLAVLAHGRSSPRQPGAAAATLGEDPLETDEDTGVVRAPMQGTIVSIDHELGASVRSGQQVLVMEAMKMEHVITATASGWLRQVLVAQGDTVAEGQILFAIEGSDESRTTDAVTHEVDLGVVRPDLAEVHARHALILDEARPEAVARRRKTGQRTARENVDDLCDPGTFVEYGSLVIAAQRSRRSVDDLIRTTPTDGLLTGIARVNGHLFDDESARCVVMSYDYTVLAGTQGQMNHRKHDRMFNLAAEGRLPLIFFSEGGGGRPGDDKNYSEGLRNPTFYLLAKLSGLVPTVAINSGRAFAGSAAILGFCDVVIAARNSSIGMGGPAMVEGGGLGVFLPEEIGPVDVQSPNGVIDVVVEDEAEGVKVAKQYLSYFQGRVDKWECADQRHLRHLVPENRLRVYDMRAVIENLADTGTMLELRKEFGLGMLTCLIRIEGRPVGVVANNPRYLAGAIDRDGSDKAARFMRLCNAFGIPILSLCDTPGIMVGPESEKTALVRHSSRVFVTAASLEVPFLTVVIRKSYGLGAMAMAGGGFRVPFFGVSWPTGEFGGMGLEGSVKLGYRKELEAIENLEERRQLYDDLVAKAYEHGKALSSAMNFEIDDVIDPFDTRKWIVAALESMRPPTSWRKRKRSRFIDTW